VSVWIDPGEPSKPVNVVEVPSRPGLAGLAWYGARFRVRGLAVQGTLDRKEAARVLRAMTAGGVEEGRDRSGEAGAAVRPRW
jgi:hypothetical protein